MRLKDKVAIVTNASGFFGGPLAVALGREGCHVVCVDDTAETAQAAAAKVTEAGHSATPRAVDLSRKGEILEMVKEVIGNLDRIDILVNATQIANNQDFLTFKEEDFDASINYGVRTHFLTCQAVAPRMMEQRSGKIINLSSIVSLLGPGQGPSHSANCGAVNGLTRSLSQALGFYGINVNAIARGSTERPPYKPGTQERLRRLALGRTQSENDLVEPCIFLASEASRFVTGQVLYVDGGYTIAGVTDDRYRPAWATSAHLVNGWAFD